MGSSSKKHKSDKTRESRKRKHRSRSKSPVAERSSRAVEVDRVAERETRETKDREKHRHSKKHHKDRKRDKHSSPSRERNGDPPGRLFKPPEDSESEDGGAPTAPPPPKISRARSPPPPPTISTSSNSDKSLSIEETNRLRAKLGLKPLQEGPSGANADAPAKTAEELMGGKDMGEFVHKPADNLSAKKKEEKLRNRLQERREKRAVEAKLAKTKTLGEDSDSEDNASAWVERSRKQQEEKDKAAKRAKMLEELDAEFGVGELVQDEFQHDASQAYSTKDLRGLKVEHAMDNIKEGRDVILTLKDKGVLDEDDDDVLVNVNIVDEERYKKNNERKKLKPNLHGYNAYDEESVDEFGNVQKNMLGKYDEEIGEVKKTSFVLGSDAEIERKRREVIAVKERLQKKTLLSLSMPEMQLAAEYYTPEEMVKFKKPKKKVRKIRKVLKASDLERVGSAGGSQDHATRVDKAAKMTSSGFRPVEDDDGHSQEEPAQTSQQVDSDDDVHMELADDIPPPPVDLSDVKLEPDEGELELQLALNKARKLKQIEDMLSQTTAERVANSVQRIKQEEEEEERAAGGFITLNATAEFCRTLGDIPTYGLAGNRDEDAEELMDFEREMTEERRRQEEERTHRGAWNEVEVDETPAEIAPPEAPILDEEPDVGMGVAGALRLAVSKGYLEKETYNRPSASRMHHLQAQNYSIEDKTHIDDDKFGRRERYAGPTTDFKERDGFKPNVKLDYIDDDGRVLNAKEAFRYLSHKFHGKGPGKNKVEKRMKKVEQEVLMKQMSSTDTPLGTLNMLQQKQKETHSAYVVLSGSKQLQSISKTKM